MLCRHKCILTYLCKRSLTYLALILLLNSLWTFCRVSNQSHMMSFHSITQQIVVDRIRINNISNKIEIAFTLNLNFNLLCHFFLFLLSNKLSFLIIEIMILVFLIKHHILISLNNSTLFWKTVRLMYCLWEHHYKLSVKTQIKV